MLRDTILGGTAEGQRFLGYKLLGMTRTISGNVSLQLNSPTRQIITPTGASRDVTLPTAVDAAEMEMFIYNAAASALNLVVKDAGVTIVTIPQNKAAWVYSNGVAWFPLLGA